MKANFMLSYVYYSHQKIGMLYRQLEDSRQVALRRSVNRHNHGELNFHKPPKEDPCMQLGRAELDLSETNFEEECYDKNEMYQLEHVLQHLCLAGKLHPLEPPPCPGDYCRCQGCFAPEYGAGAPKGSVWLCAPAAGGCPAIRLLCGLCSFLGEHEHALEELFSCDEALPLQGVVLCLSSTADCLCGLPLFLAL